jgi:hypothetical protein
MLSYVIKSGDTLSKLAGIYLGDIQKYREIAVLNPAITDMNVVKVGQVIFIPTTSSEIEAARIAASKMRTTNYALAPYVAPTSFSPDSGVVDVVTNVFSNKKLWIALFLGIAAIFYMKSKKSRSVA